MYKRQALTGQLKNRIAELHMEEKILLCGFQKDVERFYQSAAVCISTSRVEGFPCTNIESRLYGLDVYKRQEFYGYKGVKESDFDWKVLSDPEQLAAVKKVKKYFQILTLNGYFLPAKKDKVLVMPPYNNMYKMYRVPEVIYTDANGNCILTKRSGKKMISCLSLIHIS